MTPEELVLAATSLALTLSKNQSCVEIARTAKFLHTVAQNLYLILEQKAFCDQCKK
jgi:hypothetical protein